MLNPEMLKQHTFDIEEVSEILNSCQHDIDMTKVLIKGHVETTSHEEDWGEEESSSPILLLCEYFSVCSDIKFYLEKSVVENTTKPSIVLSEEDEELFEVFYVKVVSCREELKYGFGISFEVIQ